MATPFNLVSRDAQQALTEFSSDFDAALAVADAEPWAQRFGLYNPSRAIQTTYPIPISAAGYVERKGDDKMRALFEKSLSMKPKEWVDGVKAKASIVEAPDFIGWAGEPARIAREAARQPNTLVAAMLEANPLLDLYRHEHPGGSVASTIELFADTHPVNIFDASFSTFSNDSITGTEIDADLIKSIKLKFRNRLGPNGKKMGLRLTHLLVPAAREEEARDFFESDNLILAVQEGGANVGGVPTNNRHKGTVELVVCDEFTNDDLLYAVDGTKGVYPWIIQHGGSPEEIRYDKTDAMYKDTGDVGVKYVLLMAAAAALPHGIERITLS
jgi:phage major head subunit gpT-like protein